MQKEILVYMSILEMAFAPDVYAAFAGSVELAKYAGVPTEEILDSYEIGVSYFEN